MNEEGYIPLSRKAFDNFLWQEERERTRWEAWIDLIQTAAYVPRAALVEGRRLNLRRGELVASVRYLGKRWLWDKNRVSRFIALLRTERMIETRNETGVGIIKLCKYEQYNPSPPGNGTPTNHTRDSNGTATGQRKEGGEGKQNSPTAREECADDPPGTEPPLEKFVAAAARYSVPEWFAAEKWLHYSSNGWHGGKTPKLWKKLLPIISQDFVNTGRPRGPAAGAAPTIAPRDLQPEWTAWIGDRHPDRAIEFARYQFAPSFLKDEFLRERKTSK